MPDNDELPHSITIGDKYGHAMEISDQAAADAYFDRCVRHTMRRTGCSRAEAEAVERQNLAYYAGYYDPATRERVERLYKCAHPFFGPIAVNGPPTPQTAFNIGAAMGGALRRGEAR